MNSFNEINSTSNSLIKLTRSLRERKNRQEAGLFLVEGIHLVGAAIEAGWIIYTILFCNEMLNSEYAKSLLEREKKRGSRCVSVDSKVFTSLSDKDNPQGILAVVKQNKKPLSELNGTANFLGVGIISPQDPGNLGSILRTIDCVGADALLLINGGVDVFHPTCVRASMGALFWIPVLETTFEDLIDWSNQKQIKLIGSSAHASDDINKLNNYSGSMILLLGNEQKGMSVEQMAVCDLVVSLPMFGHSSSLNLSVAAGILLYAMIK